MQGVWVKGAACPFGVLGVCGIVVKPFQGFRMKIDCDVYKSIQM